MNHIKAIIKALEATYEALIKALVENKAPPDAIAKAVEILNKIEEFKNKLEGK